MYMYNCRASSGHDRPMEPVRSDEDNFREYLAYVLGQHRTTIAAVKSKIHGQTQFPKPTSLDQLSSISSGRRRPNPQAVVEIADALDAPDEFPDYNLCLLRSLLDPKVVGPDAAMHLAERLTPLLDRSSDADVSERLAAGAAEDARRPPGRQSAPKRKTRGGGARGGGA